MKTAGDAGNGRPTRCPAALLLNAVAVLLLTSCALMSVHGAFAAVEVKDKQPFPGATGVPVTAIVQATFSEALDAETVTNGSFCVSRFVGFKAVAAGGDHTVALKTDGTVVAWGANTAGETTVPAGLWVAAVAAGRRHTVALKMDGTVVAWGSNYDDSGGYLGQATVPAGLSGVKAIAAGPYHTAALKTDGSVVAWGDKRFGESTVPVGLSGVRAIATGQAHTVALKTDGTVVGWGDDLYGQTTVPAGLAGVAAIAAGLHHTVALRVDGTVTGWGANNSGQAVAPAGLSGVVAIAAGEHHTVALKSDGTVVAWGDNAYGQILVPAGLVDVVGIAGGGGHTVALKRDGTMVAWGSDLWGQVTVPEGLSGVVAIDERWERTVALRADGTVAAWGGNLYGETTVPEGLSGVRAIAAGGRHTVALKTDGAVVAWGDNYFGELTPPAELSGVAAIAAGERHTVALKTDGTVVAWGKEITMPTGLSEVKAIAAGYDFTVALRVDGTVVASTSGVYGHEVPAGLSGVVAIAAGDRHAVALKSDGTVVAWGWNSDGQATVPPGLSGVVGIAAGFNHTVALKGDGTVVAWGYDGLDQSTVPAGLAGVAAVAAGMWHTVALKKDGTVVGWGYSPVGEAAVVSTVSAYDSQVHGLVSFDAHTLTATFSPSAPLENEGLYHVVVAGVRNTAGVPLVSSARWGFTTEISPTGTISGRVTASPGSDALGGATIATTMGVYQVFSITDGDGNYLLDLLPGTYTVTASKAGYGTRTQSATVMSGATTALNFVLVRAADTPGAPIVPAASSTGTYAVNWAASGTVGASYEIQEATTADFTANVRTAYTGSGLSTSITGRATATTYYYRVRAVAAGMDPSDWVAGSNGCAVTLTIGVTPPSFLRVPGSSEADTYTVSWGKSKGKKVSYELQQAADSGFTQELTAAYTGAKTSAVIRMPGNNQTHYYRVRAMSPGSAPSAWVTASNGCAVNRTVASVTSVKVPKSSRTGRFKVSWAASKTKGITYEVHEATDATFAVGLQTVYIGTGRSVVVTDRHAGSTYYYAAKAVRDGYNQSDWVAGANGCTVTTSRARVATAMDE